MLKGLRKGSYRRKSSSRNDRDLAPIDPEFGMGPSLPPGNPSLGVSLAHLHRSKKVLSNNAAHALYGGRRRSEEDDEEAGEDEEGYALELYSDCAESVSSLNDSCFGGASVTGGYNLPNTGSPSKEATPSPLKQATSLVVGVVPPMAVSDFPSFDTEDVSVRVDLEQAVPPPSATSGAMIPITGSLNIKRKDRSRATISTAAMVSILDLPKPSSSATPIKLLPPTEAEVEISVTSNESFPCDEDFKPVTTTITVPSRDTGTITSTPQDIPAVKESTKRSWCPMCLQRAPLWLKILLLMGILLLLVAATLVVLGLVLEFHASSNQSNSVSAANRAGDTSPTLAPTTLTLPADIFIKHLSPTPPVSISPSASPTRKGRAKAVIVKTPAPTASPILTTTAPSPSVVLSYDPNTVLPAPSSPSP